MKTLGLIATALIMTTFLSFTPADPPEKLNLVKGTYGVYSYGDASEGKTRIKLVINDNSTFHYRNDADPDNKIDIKGKWVRKGNAIYLKNHGADFSFHDKWKIDKNEKCLKSRNGLNFTRLCLLDSCQ